MRAIDPNYEASDSGDFEKFPSGKYTAIAIEWFSLNDHNEPILKAQKDLKLVGRLTFILEGNKAGPPFSLTLSEMPLLVRAFGKDVKNLPALPEENQPGKITEYMKAVENICKGEVDIEVNKGWANNVKGMVVPDEYFYFNLTDIFPKDEKGDPYPRDGDYGLYFVAEFTVFAGEGGSETPYKGVKFNEIIPYAVTVVNGEPDWEKTKVTLQYSAAGQRLSNLVRMSAPSMNLLDTDYKFTNPHNILTDWFKHLSQDNVLLKGGRVKTDRRICLDLNSVKPVNGYSAPKPVYTTGASPVETKTISNLNESDSKARSIADELLSYLAGEPAVENNMLTPIGKEMAGKYIKPPKQEGKVTHGSFADLDYDDVMAIIDYVLTQISDDKAIDEIKEKLIHVGVGFDLPQKETEVDEWGDNPFS